ncbi:preprotein translocase subunit SecY [Myxococcus sp. CA051A]|uniref:Protein translocase subunit SecY n=1 Tax=Myxococcus llanfairpwllgwyngyllgogerychwyrndrobwllllantysiliogogogochensis TaxID=2590453 RepID=A0A540WZ89_9BACT|nr:preprotein translocase subunit SecY [Myxococcus llanfairpwllgwyngyllgogerychwyrndrobwllllantysiliogogogochensis]NTX07855.1 preprotein translocase subunit SecY [Myxococcus sp. CA040A]NTX14914.1 preprotein translocase subunit SecY [Myxococcus sp. CA056]NTX38819.1 preprotein translocase subunit SecY [Myxococcus sp. CA033]NTX51693.1 preprotein translocase subunit SecY [Myxococcus sp. CA039A]NTX67588.1 preprotein translocase subunit SecY [Myxococcus sp. CA051A]
MALNAFANVFRIAELRSRLAYTLALLAVYRIGIFINTPGVDRAAMNAFMDAQKQSGGLVSLFNLFSGGALEQMSIFGLGIMPYVSASIIMQLLAVVIPSLERLQKEGAAGRQKINQYTRYGTIVLSVIQGIGISRWLASLGRSDGGQSGFNQVVVPDDSVWFTFMTVISLTAGTAFIMWLGERITERGIGNGISLIIFAGIVAGVLPGAKSLLDLTRQEVIAVAEVLALLVFMLLIIAVVVYVERGMRRIPIQYAKRMAGRRMFAGQATYFPMKVNTAGVIPPIFAGAVLSFPATLGTWFPFLQDLQRAIEGNLWIYNGLFVLMVIFFAYFYTALTFRPDDVADNIKKQGGYIPGIRPGRQTAEFIERVLNRLTFGGALYLAVICVIPSVISGMLNVRFTFGGTALLIVVGVALDTVQQIEGHLISRNYEGFAGPRGPRIRGRVRVAA